MNKEWKGEGYCPARHKMEHNDYCNRPVVKGSRFCREDTCDLCKGQAVQWFVLMSPEQRYCSKHSRSEAR
jgi:hypothetical protein